VLGSKLDIISHPGTTLFFSLIQPPPFYRLEA
jgi:hypothetical protein